MNDHYEFHMRSPMDVFLAIMDKLGIKIDLEIELYDESEIWKKAEKKRRKQ